MIEKKTASLFELSCSLGVLSADNRKEGILIDYQFLERTSA